MWSLYKHFCFIGQLNPLTLAVFERLAAYWGNNQGPPQYDSAVMYGRFHWGPQLDLHDAQRHQFLGQLYV